MKTAPQKISQLCMAVVMATAVVVCAPPTIDGGSGRATFGNSDLKLDDAKWGRLVDVFDIDGLLYDVDIVIREAQGQGRDEWQ